MGRRNRTRQKKTKYCDYSLFFLIIFLLGFGLVMLYSVSAYNANEKYSDPMHYLRRQGLAVVLGIAAMTLISKIDYHVWFYFGNLAYLLASCSHPWDRERSKRFVPVDSARAAEFSAV